MTDPSEAEGSPRPTGRRGGSVATISYLVNLAIANSRRAREPGSGREASEGGGPDGTAGAGHEGRASRPGNGGNAAMGGQSAQLAAIGPAGIEKVDQGVVTNLLNILPDDGERFRMGVER